MSPPPRGRCPVCGRSITIRGFDGRLRKHGFLNGQYDRGCPGSGRAPAPPTPTPPEPRTHHRRTQ